ncbi:hypothetical protein I4U23_010795 [Adineta vaga]|nr:hypothetical protein I4U23_010795 [Adineta vaga]
MTCDLHSTRDVLYRTYSAYKSHIHRKHLTKLHSIEKHIDTFSINDQRIEDTNFLNETDSLDSVTNTPEAMPIKDYLYNNKSQFDLNLNDEEIIDSIKDMKKSNVLFILQFRQDSEIRSRSDFIPISNCF